MSLQCQGCARTIEAAPMEKQVGTGAQLKVGLLRTVLDRYGNVIIAEIKCADCVTGEEGS